jgi:ABC-2 type transport system ATP-binding protein
MGVGKETMSNAIFFDNVYKQYNSAEKKAVDGLSFSVERGEVFGLLGPNGAGKSTSVMMLCGLTNCDVGNIKVLDLDVSTNSRLVRKKIGVAPQDIALFPTLTANENLCYFGRMYGLSSQEINTQISNLVERFGLSDKLKKPVQSYSGGMKRRLNLIAALLHSPELLLLDEPTAGVDVQSRSLITEYLKEINQKGITILYSSHLMDEAERVCNRFGFIDNGKMIAIGSLQELKIEHPDCDSLEDIFLKLTGRNVRE